MGMSHPWLRALSGQWRRLGRREIRMLVAVLLIAGGLWGFGALAEEVLEGETGKFDEAILLALRVPGDTSDPIGPGWVEEVARDITSLGGNTVLSMIVAIVVGYLLMVRKRAAALLVFVSVAGGMLLSMLLKTGFARTRPDLVPHEVQVYTLSFPSGHAMLSAVTYLTLGALLMRLESQARVKAYLMGVAVVLSLLVGISRVYLGVHWPTDVLGGWCVGAAWAMLCWLVALWLQRRGTVETEGSRATGGQWARPDTADPGSRN